MNAVEVKNLCFKYDNRKEYIFKDVNFNVRTGETIAITGRSGSGITTLCLCICGLVPRLYKGELTGEVLIFGENIKNLSIAEVVTKIGIIFQILQHSYFLLRLKMNLHLVPKIYVLKEKNKL